MRKVTLVEVGPRDGLQNEPHPVSTDLKLELITRLVEAGFARIEATAFVSPRWVPQMADHAEVMRGLPRAGGVRFSALVPNVRGAEAALEAGAAELAVFAGASETFSQRNINCTIAESLTRFEPVMRLASEAGVPVRGYVSCVTDCPYEGAIAPEAVASVAEDLSNLGCYEIALGETLGRGTPERVARMIEAVSRVVPVARLAGHFHDTGGRAIANIGQAWALGVSVFDCAVGGLGGCPYAPGAAGNVASERVVSFFEASGVRTGVDEAALLETAQWVRSIVTPVEDDQCHSGVRLA
jgi:hydroxymethylglutaryl-CoA lyase